LAPAPNISRLSVPKLTSHPITELSNELTLELDLADPVGVARLFRQSDAQLFAGWRDYPSLFDGEVIEQCARLAVVVSRAVEAGEKGIVLLAGAGTSGRFAALISRAFNRLLRAAHKPAIFRPLVAGGYKALVKAQEGAEDDPDLAVQDLKNALPDSATDIVYFGITCGLSAPYIGGQIDHLSLIEDATSVLVGFNPLDSARDVPVESWKKTFAEVIRPLTGTERFHVLNPIYGPEAIMGSTRLKGGSATKILLETIFYVGLELAGVVAPDATGRPPSVEDPESIAERIHELLSLYREVVLAAHDHLDDLASLIRVAGNTLRSGGRINYLGRETAGIVGIIDATECPPTFGASFEDVRGFLRGGWPELLDEKNDLSANGPEYNIDLDYFEKEKLPDLSKGDLVLGIAIGELGPVTRSLLEKAEKSKATTGVILVTAVPPKKDDLPGSLEHRHIIKVPSLGFQPGFYNLAELALKIILNGLSSGAHVQVGKVYHNRMIDLRISNQKLYFRALGTIERLTGVDTESARVALHRAAFRKDTLDKTELEASPSTVIKAGSNRPRVVPTALLLALGSMTYEQAQNLLAKDPVARRVIKAELDRDDVASKVEEE
jgi:N-acetylmuramic acid 6-phosphate (MurNAc-6-P) etherase